MLVSFFSFRGFTVRSFERLWIPTTMPSYTSVPGPTIMRPRFCRLNSAYPTALPVAFEISTPDLRPVSRPAGTRSYPAEENVITPDPDVKEANSLRNPINARVDTLHVSRTRPWPSWSTSTSSPLRSPSASIRRPWCSASISKTTDSKGSRRTPSRSRTMTIGCETATS